MPSKLTPEQLDQLIGALDDALQSDTPAVVNALQNLVLLSGLSSENHDGPGPLRQLFDRVDRLDRELRRLDEYVRHLESKLQYRDSKQYIPDTRGNIAGHTPSWAIYDEWDSIYRFNISTQE